MLTVRQAIPKDWIDRIADVGPISLGMDIATTDKGTSNPSSLTVMQHTGRMFYGRLVLAWKTADPEITESIIETVLDDIQLAGHPVRGFGVDSSNEKFFAKRLAKKFAPRVPVVRVGGGEKLTHRGFDLDAKTLLGNLYVTALEDGFITLPLAKWITDDHRLVATDRGSFVTATGKGGWHGDTFDGAKLAYWIHESRSGRAVQASAAQVGGINSKKPQRPGLIGRLRNRRASTLAS